MQQQKQELFYSDLDQISSVQYQDGTDSFVVFTLRDNKFNIVGSIVYEVKELDTNPPSGSSSDFKGKKYNREHVCVYLNNGSKIIYNQTYSRPEDVELMYDMLTTPLNTNAVYRFGKYRTSKTNNVNVNTIIYDKPFMPRKITVTW